MDHLDKSGLIFTYGVTNAGKTHTIMGRKNDSGILPKTLKTLIDVKTKIEAHINDPNAVIELSPMHEIRMEKFIKLAEYPDYKFESVKLYLESFEIYNEEIYDLLIENKKDRLTGQIIRNKLNMKEKDNKKVYIKGKIYHKSTYEIDKIMLRFDF